MAQPSSTSGTCRIGRHALTRKICHGNCVTLWTTVYLDAADRQLKAQGYPVREEDMARLSPFVNQHLGVHGTYSFALPDLAPGATRELRDPEAGDGE